MMMIFAVLAFSLISITPSVALAEGDEPLDGRDRIGFTGDPQFYLEENSGIVEMRVYVSKVQSVPVTFTLTETPFGLGQRLFVFKDKYVLPAGNLYVDIVFNQIAGAESGDGVRLSDIYIHCDTTSVTVGDVEYYGEDEPYDDDFLAVVCDLDGEAEIIMGGLPHIAYEGDGSISSKMIRSGIIPEDTKIYYRIRNYDTSRKELLFDNYDSVLAFNEGERERKLELVFFDNNYLNLRDAYVLDIVQVEGVSKIFDLSMRRYLETGEVASMPFAIMDDEPLSDKYNARVQYYQPGETDPHFEITEGSTMNLSIICSGLNGKMLDEFRVYYTITMDSTAVFNFDYMLGDYDYSKNLGYIDVPAGGEVYMGVVPIPTWDNTLFDGTKTIYFQFFINNRSDILLQALDTIRIDITDNEYLPDDNTIGWLEYGSLNGCGDYDAENQVLTVSSGFSSSDSFVVGTGTDYRGTAPLSIPVRISDVTASRGIDYAQESEYAMLTYYRQYGDNLYGIDLEINTEFFFNGVRRIKVSIVEDALMDGLTLVGSPDLYIDIVGIIEDDYCYIDYTEAESCEIFNVGLNESLTFTLKRYDKGEKTTYIDSRPGAFEKGVHYEGDLFPYAVLWQEGEVTKQITFEFLQNHAGNTQLLFLGSDKQEMNFVCAENQHTAVDLRLQENYSAARYYFPAEFDVGKLVCEYLYSTGELLIEVTREMLSLESFASSVEYSLTFEYDPTKNWQIILAADTADIGTYIDDLSGTLYFMGAETTKYITVTVPDYVRMAAGSKYVNIKLENPSEKTYILRNWDYDLKYDTAKIKITNDVTPMLEYSGVTTVEIEDGDFTRTVINALSDRYKNSDVFGVQLIPYETDETPYMTNLYYEFDVYLYAGYDLSEVGVEIWREGRRIECQEVDPYSYEYEDSEGTHSVIYSYAYIDSVLVNGENPYAYYSMKYTSIGAYGLDFVSTSLLLRAQCDYFMSGEDTFEHLMFLEACAVGATVDLTVTTGTLISENAIDVQVGDIIYLTLERSSEDAGANTMFYTSSKTYAIKNTSIIYNSRYYFVSVDTYVSFAPYERYKTVAFVTCDSRPEFHEWNAEEATTQVIVYDYYDHDVTYREITVRVHEEWQQVINASVSVVNDNIYNLIYVHKQSGQPSDIIQVKFTFDRAYQEDISFNVLGLDARVGNLGLVLVAGDTEIVHSFTFDEAEFDVSRICLDMTMTALVTSPIGASLSFVTEGDMNVNIISMTIRNASFNVKDPEEIEIREDSLACLTLEIDAIREGNYNFWNKEIWINLELGGTAVYGEDYIVKYQSGYTLSSFNSERDYNFWVGAVPIEKFCDILLIKIYPLDDSILAGNVSLEIKVYEYFSGYSAYIREFTFTFVDYEYSGDLSIYKAESAQYDLQTVVINRVNFTPSDLIVNYSVEDVVGEYGVDYVFQSPKGTNIAKSGFISLTGREVSKVIYIYPLNEKGKQAAFYCKILSAEGFGHSIIKDQLFGSIRAASDGGDYSVRTESNDAKLIGCSNYLEYTLDYTKYYSQYLSAKSSVLVQTVDIGRGSEKIFVEFNPSGISKVYSDKRLAKYDIPSGISFSHWEDLNGDGIKELIFVSNLDTCFGGAVELTLYGKVGIYALDIINGTYTDILVLPMSDASNHLDVFVADLDADTFFEVVVFATPWLNLADRQKGGNVLYIVDNESGSFKLTNIYDSGPKKEENDKVLHSISIQYNYKEMPRTYLAVNYYAYTSSGLQYGMILDFSAGIYVDCLYLSVDKYYVTEGGNIYVYVHNLSGKAGSATLSFVSTNGEYGRDYIPESLTLNFREGEYSKYTFLVSKINYTLTGDIDIDILLESEDYYTYDRTLKVSLGDSSVMNHDASYTILDGFDESYTSSNFITGDSAKFSIEPLTIDGIKALNNSQYDVRLKVRFGETTWTSVSGISNVSGLIAIYNVLSPAYIFYTIEFLKKGTNTVFSTRTEKVAYLYFDREDRENCKIINNVEINRYVYFGGKERILVESIISINGNTTQGRFTFDYTSTVDNKRYSFTDNHGSIDASIVFGSAKGEFSYSYVLTPLSVGAAPYTSAVNALFIYQEKMDYPISVNDSLRQTLLRHVKIEVRGINTTYYYSGYSNAETGAFIIPDITPEKSYMVIVNDDYGISYFDSYTAEFTASLDQPSLSINLALRTEQDSLDKVTVYVIPSERVEHQIAAGQTGNGYHEGQYNYLVDYLAGRSTRPLSIADEVILNNFLKSIYLQMNYPSTDAFTYLDRYNSDRYEGTYYHIRKDVLFSSDYPNVYRSMSKNESDLIIVFYRYNPDSEFGNVKVKLSGTELGSLNSFNRSLNLTYPHFYSNYWSEETDCASFYVVSGAENCIIDLEIESDAYLNGKKVIQLASFGTGLGSFLLHPIQNMFESLETAEVPANLAFLNGMSFMLGFADIDFAFDYDEENATFSLYMGVSKDIYEKSHGMSYGDMDRPTLSQLRARKDAGLGTGRGGVSLGVGLGGKMIFKYINGSWDLVAGEVYISASISYNYTKYILIPVVSIPAFFSATITLEIGTTIYFNWNEVEECTEVTGDLAIELSLEIECGIGIKGFLSASIYGKAGIEVIIQMDTGGSKLTLYVEGGVRIQIIFWSYHHSFGRAEWSTESDDYIDREEVLNSVRLGQLSNANTYSGVATLYNANGDMIMAIGLGENGGVEDVLVSNIYEKGTPQIAELADGTKMIAWINYDLARGKNNAEVINYIYFDGENWSEVLIADESLTADLEMQLVVIDGSFAIVCSEVKEELASDATLSERLLKSDVVLFEFDKVIGLFKKTVITNNLYNDRQALTDYNDGSGITIVYRSENSNITDDMTINDFLCGENAANRLYFGLYDNVEKTWSELLLFDYSLPAVSTMSLKIVRGIAYIVLECDLDDNFDTTGDRELFLLQYIFATGSSRLTQITENNVQDLSPSIMQFMDKAFIAYRSGDDIKYWYEGNSYFIGTLPQSYTEFSMFTDNDCAVLLYTMSIEGVAQAFASVMDAETMIFSAPTQITFSDKPVRSPILSFSEDDITIYYCADTYTLTSSPTEEYAFEVTSAIVRTSFQLYSELSLEVLSADYSLMLPGEEFTFVARVYNQGTFNVSDPWIKVFYGELLLGEFLCNVVAGNSYTDVEIKVTLPLTRATILFEVGKDGLVEETANNTTQFEVLLTNISIGENYSLTWNEDGTLTAVLSVTNQGAVDISNVNILITPYSNYSSNLASLLIPQLTPGQTISVTLTIAKEAVTFNASNELWLKAHALISDSDIYTVGIHDYDTSNNLRSMHIARMLFAGGSSLAILTTNISLKVGEKRFLNYIYTGDNALIITSSDTSILTVNGRNITAISSGSVIITVFDGVETKEFYVTVVVADSENENTIIEPDDTVLIDVVDPSAVLPWWAWLLISLGTAIGGAAAILLVIRYKKNLGKNNSKNKASSNIATESEGPKPEDNFKVLSESQDSKTDDSDIPEN